MCTEKLLESRHSGQLAPAQSRAHRIPSEQNACGFKSLRLGVASHTLVLAGERSRSASWLDWGLLRERRAGSALLFAEQPWTSTSESSERGKEGLERPQGPPAPLGASRGQERSSPLPSPGLAAPP